MSNANSTASTSHAPQVNGFRWLLGSTYRVVFGFDYFISYTWRDREDSQGRYGARCARQYAVKMRDALRDQGLVCFLDSEDYAKGQNWRFVGQLALRGTSRLIVILSPAVTESQAVLDEVEYFKNSTRKAIVPIEFTDCPPLGDASRLLSLIEEEALRVREEAATLVDGPSLDAIGDLVRTFNLTRQTVVRQRLMLWTSTVLCVLLIATAIAGYIARRNHQRAEANFATAEARRLSLESQLVQSQGPKRATRLAATSLQFTKSEYGLLPETLEAFVGAARGIAGRSLNTGSVAIRRMCYSAEADSVATIDEAGMVALWSIKDHGAEWLDAVPAVLDTGIPDPSHFSFSRTGDFLLISNSESTNSLLRITNGRLADVTPKLGDSSVQLYGFDEFKNALIALDVGPTDEIQGLLFWDLTQPAELPMQSVQIHRPISKLFRIWYSAETSRLIFHALEKDNDGESLNGLRIVMNLDGRERAAEPTSSWVQAGMGPIFFHFVGPRGDVVILDGLPPDWSYISSSDRAAVARGRVESTVSGLDAPIVPFSSGAWVFAAEGGFMLAKPDGQNLRSEVAVEDLGKIGDAVVGGRGRFMIRADQTWYSYVMEKGGGVRRLSSCALPSGETGQLELFQDHLTQMSGDGRLWIIDADKTGRRPIKIADWDGESEEFTIRDVTPTTKYGLDLALSPVFIQTTKQLLFREGDGDSRLIDVRSPGLRNRWVTGSMPTDDGLAPRDEIVFSSVNSHFDGQVFVRTRLVRNGAEQRTECGVIIRNGLRSFKAADISAVEITPVPDLSGTRSAELAITHRGEKEMVIWQLMPNKTLTKASVLEHGVTEPRALTVSRDGNYVLTSGGKSDRKYCLWKRTGKGFVGQDVTGLAAKDFPSGIAATTIDPVHKRLFLLGDTGKLATWRFSDDVTRETTLIEGSKPKRAESGIDEFMSRLGDTLNRRASTLVLADNSASLIALDRSGSTYWIEADKDSVTVSNSRSLDLYHLHPVNGKGHVIGVGENSLYLLSTTDGSSELLQGSLDIARDLVAVSDDMRWLYFDTGKLSGEIHLLNIELPEDLRRPAIVRLIDANWIGSSPKNARVIGGAFRSQSSKFECILEDGSVMQIPLTQSGVIREANSILSNYGLQ